MSIVQTFTSIFNPRECAILTLAAVGVVFALFFRAVRKGLKDLAKIFFGLQLFRIYTLMIIYAVGCVFILYQLDLWELPLLKDTIKWFLFAASVMFFKIQKFQQGKAEYAKTFREIFAGSTLLEFFTDKFSFGYLTELILIPAATLLALMKVFTEKEERYSQVNTLLRRLLMLLGFFFLGHILYSAMTEWQHWANMDSLKEFLLAPVLSILLLPFIFFLAVHMTYQTQFLLLANKFPDRALLRYARRRAMLAFGLDQQSLTRWQGRLTFEQVTTKAQLVKSIKDLKNTQRLEKHPPPVPYEKGWSPQLAADFLKPVFNTKYYDPRFEDNWMTDSNLVYVGREYHSNYFRYEILGKADAVTALELHLNVMAPLEETDLTSPLLAYASRLYQNAMGAELPAKLENAIINSKNCRLTVNGTKIRFTKEIWKNTLNDSYSLTLAFYRGKRADF